MLAQNGRKLFFADRRLTGSIMAGVPSKRIKLPLNPRTLLRTILMLDDTPHRIALGTAIGMFIGLTPTVGIQMLLVLLFAFTVRRFFTFNQMAAVVTVYVTNPFTLLPIYWFNYEVGTILVPATIDYAAFAAIFEYQGFSEWWNTVSHIFVDIGAPLIVGSLIVAVTTSIPTYPIMRWLVHRFRDHDGPSPSEKNESRRIAEADRLPVTSDS